MSDYIKSVGSMPSTQQQDIARDIATIIENEKDMRVVLKQPRWIPCSERLPEHNQICIVTDETRRCAYEYGLHDETYDEENGWTYLGHKIIAWMPLPEPYKGE